MSFPRPPLFPSSWRLFALAQVILVLMLFAAFGSTFSVVTAPIHRRRGGALFSTAPAESESGTAVAATPAEGQYMEPGKYDDTVVTCCLRAFGMLPIVVDHPMEFHSK